MQFLKTQVLVVLICLQVHPLWASETTLRSVKAAEQEPVHIGNRLELFVDSTLISSMDQTELRLHHPIDEGPVLYFDKPWEGPFSAYCTVIDAGGKFQMYYRGLNSAGKDGLNDETTCYAESDDGIHWIKPDLKIFERNGTLNNNIILAQAMPVSHNFSPFLDNRHNVDPAQKYKALGGNEKSGLIAYISADGIHWQTLQKEAVFKNGKFDSQNVSFWSESEQSYLCYFRTWTGSGYKGFRTVSRTTSPDFVHWTDPEEMNYGNTTAEHIYVNQTAPYFRAPHIYIATAARFMPGRQVLTEEQAKSIGVNPDYFKDCSDVVLMTSRGKNRYYRLFMEGFINPGTGYQNWVSRANYPALNIIQTGPAEMSIYVNKDYAQPTAHINRYTLRLDGFVSVYAPYQGGVLLTKPLRFTGKHLFINFATSAAGSIRAEILDENGYPIPGYTKEDCIELIGNEIRRVVAWQNGGDIDHLAGRTIQLRFFMKDAHLYALQFN